jgi:peptidoglycan/LPS O-acetylase OafA/YrhL
MNRIQIVDLVRSLSILTVLAAHLGCHYILNTSPWPILHLIWYKAWINGAFGVTSFFVVSGFVISRLIDSQPGGLFRPNFRDFYTRRFGRIVPLLTLTCLVGYILISVIQNAPHPFDYCLKNPNGVFDLAFWISIATFTSYWYKALFHIHNNGLHWDLLWSLSVEEQFYFFYPFLLKKLGSEKKLKFFLVALVFYPPLYAVFAEFYFPRASHPFWGGLQPFGSIAMGCLLYLFWRRFRGALLENKKNCWWFVGAGLLVFGDAFLTQDYKLNYWGHIFGFFQIGLGVSLFLLGGIQLDFFESKYWTPLARPGILSYGAYLMHPAILYFLWPYLVGKNEFWGYFIFTATTLSIAQLSFQFYETPTNRWVRRMFAKAGGPI